MFFIIFFGILTTSFCHEERLIGDVNIGALMSLHQRKGVQQCGQFDIPALGLAEAIKFSVQRINEDDSILPGIKLGYVIMDCCQSPVRGAKNVYKLAIRNAEASLSNRSRSIVAVIGALVSQTALPVSTIIQAVDLPIIGSLATSEELSSNFHRKFLRTIPADGNQAKAIADIIEFYGWRYVAAIAEDDSYGRSGVLALQREARKRKSFAVGISEFVYQGQYDLISSIVYKLKQRATVRVIILWMLHASGKSVLQAAIGQGIVGRTWIMSESLSMQQHTHLGEEIISRGNFIGVLPRPRVYESFKKHILSFTPKTSIGNPWWEEFWKEEFGCSPKDCARNLRIKGDFLMKLCNDYIPFVVDAVYALAHALDDILKCLYPHGLLKGGRCPSSPITRVTSDELYVYLRKTKFKGLTGTIEFDENGDPTDALFDIVYFHINESGNYTKIPLKTTVGSWEKKANQSLTLHKDMIRWNGKKEPGPSECREECRPGKRKAITTAFCWECINCAQGWVTTRSGQMNCTKCSRTQFSNNDRSACVDLPLINIKWNDVSSMLLIVVSLLGVILCLVVLVVFLKYISTPLIKASSPEMCFLLLLATASCFMLSFLDIATPTEHICALLKPLRYIIFTVSCSILGLKTVRIVHAFQVHTKSNFIKNLVKTGSRQLLSLSVLFILDVILVVCWLFIDSPTLHVSVTQDGFIFLSCEDYNRTSGKVMMMTMLSYLIVIAIWSTIYSFRARNLPGCFNEAKYIAFSMYIILLSWIAYLPVGYALKGWYVAVVSSATSLVSAYGVLGCIFFPKLYVIFLHPDRNTKDSVRAELHVFSRVDTFKTTMCEECSPT